MKDPIRSHEASVSEASVQERTGRRREDWFALLDAAGATAWTHTGIARWLREEHGVDLWWCQSLTVGYEQARGMRLPGQRSDGTWEAGASLTLPAASAEVWSWCVDDVRRAGWLDVEPVLRGGREGRDLRWTWPTGARVLVTLTALPDGAVGPRTRLTVTHRGLADADDVQRHKLYWRERLEALRDLVAAVDGS